jgi:hypothetical protein
VSLVVLEHVDLLRELAVALLALVLLDALVQFHVVTQCVLRLHAWDRSTSQNGSGRVCPTHCPHSAMLDQLQD